MMDFGHKINLKHAYIAGAFAVFVFIIFAIAGQITPFGSQTFLMFDMKRQYVDYYAYLRSILSGENNIFYSFSTTLGAGTVGFEVYYVTSPFLLLLNLFPQEYIPMGITLIIGLKLVCAAMIMDAYLQYYISDEYVEINVKDVTSLTVFIGAISWAFCGFLISQSMNTMWIDVVILLPVLAWSIDRIVQKGSILPYLCCICIMLYLNYYITYQTLIFAAVWTIVRIVELKVDRPLGIILKTIGATILAPCIDAFFLVPTVYELMNSPKDITQLGLRLQDKNLYIPDVLSKLPTLAYDYTEARTGNPQVFCGVLFIILGFLFFLNKRIAIREKICVFVMLSLLMLSFCRDIVNLFMHAGMEPSGHPYRQAFLWVFIVIISGSKALKDIPRTSPVVMVAAIAGTGIIMLNALRTRYDHISNLTVTVNIVMIAIYVVLLVAYGFMAKKGIDERRLLIVFYIIAFIQISDVGANAVYTYKYESLKCNTQEEYKSIVKTTSEAVDWIKNQDDTFFRMENLTPRQQNDGMQYSFNGVTHYSSAGMTYVRYFLQRLGFNDDSLYTHYGHDNTMTMDSLLGIKYQVTDGTYDAHHDYINVRDGEQDVYLNPYVLSTAIGTSDYDLDNISMPTEIISSDNWYEGIPDSNPFEIQEDMLGRLVGEELNIFTSADIETNTYTTSDGNVCEDISVITAAPGEVFFYLDGIRDQIQGLTVFLNGELLSTYGNASCLKILNLGFHEAGESIAVTVDGGAPEADFGEALIVTEDVGELSRAVELLHDNQAEVDKKSSSHLKITVGDYDGLFTSIPAERGWNVKVDGEKVSTKTLYGALTYIDIPQNGKTEHEIDMIYNPEGIGTGIVISLIAIIATLFNALYIRRKQVNHI